MCLGVKAIAIGSFVQSCISFMFSSICIYISIVFVFLVLHFKKNSCSSCSSSMRFPKRMSVVCTNFIKKKAKRKAQKNEHMKVQKKKKRGTCVLAGKGLVFFLIFGVYVYL